MLQQVNTTQVNTSTKTEELKWAKLQINEKEAGQLPFL